MLDNWQGDTKVMLFCVAERLSGLDGSAGAQNPLSVLEHKSVCILPQKVFKVVLL